MARPPPSFLARLRELKSPFTTEEAAALFGDLSPSSVSVYLSHAVRAGFIEQVGFKSFRHAARPGEGRPLSRLTSRVVDRLRSELLPSAFEQLVVWDDDTLAPFVHDAFPEPFVVIEGDRKSIQAVQRILGTEFEAEVVRGRQSLGERIWGQQEPGRPATQVFLVETGRLHGTRPSAHGFQIPTVSRLLIVVLEISALFPDAPLRMVESREFSLRDALDAAPSKRAAARLGAFLAWAVAHHPGHPVRREAQHLLPHVLEA